MNVLALAASPVDAGLLRRELGDEVEGAQERLDQTLQSLRSGGVDARGTTGDSEGMVALQDALASFQADRVVVVDDAAVAEEATERLDVPVTSVQST